MKPLLDSAEKHGAKLAVEAYLKTAVNSPGSFLRLKELTGGSDALCCNIDVTSLYNDQDLWDPMPKVEQICNGLAGHYGLGHIKGVALKDGFHIHVELAPITEDTTDWTQVLRLMAPYIPQDSWLILEHMFSPEEARSSLAHLRKAADDAGVSLEQLPRCIRIDRQFTRCGISTRQCRRIHNHSASCSATASNRRIPCCRCRT